MTLARQFQQLWNSSTAPPDVFGFLRQQNSTDPEQWLAVLLTDQQHRWRTDQPLQVEDYIAALPDLPPSVDWKLQLAIGEFDARRNTPTPLNDQEISSRFPDLGDTLRDRLQKRNLGNPASPGHSVPNTAVPHADLQQIDQICDAFEEAWNASEDSPQLDEFLNQGPALDQKTLLTELLKVELWWRKERGEQPQFTDYEIRWPEYASSIRQVFAQPVSSSRRQSRQHAILPDGQVMPTVVKAGNDGSSVATYISSDAIGAQQKGRYRLDHVLGEGAFGRVYLGYDAELQRQVAIKVPTKARFQKPEDAEAYLDEARTVASLDHPHIVPVYDMGRTTDGSIYVVSKFIEGTTLQGLIKAGRPDMRLTAQLLVTVALALQHAHDRRLIHRDIKPANILLEEKTNTPYVADFGLAIREEDYLKKITVAGTPDYMSPEQIRGEGHRLDGRSDIFSMGVILYQLLTGQKPFHGSSIMETLHLVQTREPRPLREVLESIPAELERICLKALSKRTSDRYASAQEFADDLEQWLKPVVAVAPVRATVQVVPKGLRSFDASDADYFQDLLPGQRNRDGLPESIAFWKQRIEQTDPDQTFSVGLIYGPSGCGKSSLVKAGLLPQLSDSVIAVYVEATPEDTETRILRGLKKRVPGLEASSEPQGENVGRTFLSDPESTGRNAHRTSNQTLTTSPTELVATLQELRRNHSQKIVIIIDQFEQWLHARQTQPDLELVKALRQCDGGRLQAIIMIRDDFYVAALRLMQALDIEVVPGRNFLLVDLFDVDHARKVLIRFGQAFGKLPANAANLSAEEDQFVSTVASGLAQDGKVVSVRLSLLAEMVKSKPWTPETLQQVGGTAGIGVNFLEETFASVHADPRFRRHSAAARGILKSLLPELDTDIKGHMRSQQELLEASGYADRPADFKDLLRILDGELRLITPTDPEGDSLSDSARNSSLATRFYQLTHDYLVPSLREWLTKKQKETRKGRAELKLEERTAIWSAKQENKQLPTLTEWFSIGTLTDSNRWTGSQRSMMRKAGRVHGIQWGGLFLAIVLIATGLQQWASAERWRNLQEQTRAAAESLQNNLGPTVPVNLKELGRLPTELVLPELQTRFAATTNPRHKLSLAFALADYGQLDAEYLASRIDDIAQADHANYITALQTSSANAVAALKAEARKCIEKPLWRRKAKLAIGALALGDTELAVDVCTYENRPDPEQRTLFIDEFPKWELDLNAILVTVRNSDSSGLRSGICLAVGSVPAENVSDPVRESWHVLASKWFVEYADSSTHSATGWLLRQWQLPLPEIPNPHEVTAERDWFVNSIGATMLRIPTGPAWLSYAFSGKKTEKSPDKTIDEFWVCDREVSRGQFEQFMNDTNYPTTEKPADWGGVEYNVSPTADHPAQQVSWFDAVMYCNWLSHREGLTPCYERSGTKEKGGYDDTEYDAWRHIPGGTGYRLPYEAEWEYACRAGTTTDASSGNDKTLLMSYCQMFPSKLTSLCGQKLPNAWGLHDVHGNVYEWCVDLYAYGGSRQRMLRGGCWHMDAGYCQSTSPVTYAPSDRNTDSGFRLALSSPSGRSPEAEQGRTAEPGGGGTEGAQAEP